MRAKIFCLTMAALLCAVLCGCNGAEHELSEGTYAIYVDSIGVSPSITFDLTENTFEFMYNPVLSYIPRGTISMENGIVTATTDDGEEIYIFEIKDDGTIAFIQEGSSEVETYERMTRVVDGTEFYFAGE